MAGMMILNNGPLPDTKPEIDVAAHLRSDINRLKGEFYDLEHGRVDYESMRTRNPDPLSGPGSSQGISRLPWDSRKDRMEVLRLAAEPLTDDSLKEVQNALQ